MLYRYLSGVGGSLSAIALDVSQEFWGRGGRGLLELAYNAIEKGVNIFHIDVKGDAINGTKNFNKKKLQGKRQIYLSICVYSSDFLAELENTIDRLGEIIDSDCVDLLFIGGVDRLSWDKFKQKQILKKLENQKSQGKVKLTGIEFRDQFEILRQIVEEYPFDCILTEISLLDLQNRPGIATFAYAQSKGIGVFVRNSWYVSNWAFNSFDNLDPGLVDIRWVVSQEGVMSVLLPCSNYTIDRILPLLGREDWRRDVTFEEKLKLFNLKDQLAKARPLRCAGCYACMSCPENINIPRIFDLYTQAIVYRSTEPFKTKYFLEGHIYKECNFCGICVNLCPRHINIPYWLMKARELFKGVLASEV